MGQNNFIDRSILGVATFLKSALYADEYVQRAGFLQKRNPRPKIIFCLFILGAGLCIKESWLLLELYFIVLLLSLASKISLSVFLKRTLVFIPFFSFCIAIPALFSVVSPGAVVSAFTIFGYKLAITKQGISASVLFLLRVSLSVSAVVLLHMTTQHARLLRALRAFGIPQIFIMILQMCYRYIYLFAQLVEHFYLAIKSRVGARLPYHTGNLMVSGRIAHLWQKGMQMSEELYAAMRSRGYNGESMVLREKKG